MRGLFEKTMGGMIGNDEDIQKKRRALLPALKNEEDALRYARRIAALRPGDIVKVISDDDTGLEHAVFVSFDTSNPPSAVVLCYNDSTQRLRTGLISLHSLVLD